MMSAFPAAFSVRPDLVTLVDRTGARGALRIERRGDDRGNGLGRGASRDEPVQLLLRRVQLPARQAHGLAVFPCEAVGVIAFRLAVLLTGRASEARTR